MSELDSMLENWKRHKDITYMVSHDVFGNPDTIRTYLGNLSDDERHNATLILDDILRELELYISNLASEKQDIKEQMDRTLKSAQACISYGATAGLGHKKDRK